MTCSKCNKPSDKCSCEGVISEVVDTAVDAALSIGESVLSGTGAILEGAGTVVGAVAEGLGDVLGGL